MKRVQRWPRISCHTNTHRLLELLQHSCPNRFHWHMPIPRWLWSLATQGTAQCTGKTHTHACAHTRMHARTHTHTHTHTAQALCGCMSHVCQLSSTGYVWGAAGGASAMATRPLLLILNNLHVHNNCDTNLSDILHCINYTERHSSS